MTLIDNLKWRYATKKFDTSKKVSPTDLETIKNAISLSASSYGLQLYKVLIIEDPEVRKKLTPVSWGQSQIEEASHLIVFANYAKVLPEHIDKHIALKAEKLGVSADQFKGYGDFVKGKIANLTPDQQNQWTSKQTYIALGNLLAACAELKIDACPMEGFEPEAYNDILGLSEQGLNAAVIATIGYRSSEDKTASAPKVRKPLEELFSII